MALSTGSGNRSGSLYFLEPKGAKEGEQIHFRQAKTEGDKIVQIEDKSMKEVSGKIEDVKFKTETYKDETKDVVILQLSDHSVEETYLVKLSFSNVGRSIFNSLLGIQAPAGNLSISLYNRSKDGFATSAVKHNGAQASWKYSVDELNKYISKTPKKKKDASGKLVTVEEKDYAELNEFLLGELKAWAAATIVKSAKPAPEDAPKSDDQDAKQAANSEDLPF